MIELRQVQVNYGKTLALDSIDLLLRPGITGLFGPNGAGKSTLLRVVAGLLTPSAGTVHLNGSPLDTRNEETRRQIAYSGHETGLYRQLTVRENLDLFAKMCGASPQRIDEVLDAVGLSDKTEVRVGRLSAGLARRAAVARAIVGDPKVLLLDEPYANLDDEAAENISASIRAWSSGDRYALIATHGAKRVKSFADAGIILQRGCIVSYRRRTEQEATS